MEAEKGRVVNKGGRPALEAGKRRTITSVSLTPEQQIKLRRLGGSKWLREAIEKAHKELDNAKPARD